MNHNALVLAHWRLPRVARKTALVVVLALLGPPFVGRWRCATISGWDALSRLQRHMRAAEIAKVTDRQLRCTAFFIFNTGRPQRKLKRRRRRHFILYNLIFVARIFIFVLRTANQHYIMWRNPEYIN